jgi:hypothetical protein
MLLAIEIIIVLVLPDYVDFVFDVAILDSHYQTFDAAVKVFLLNADHCLLFLSFSMLILDFYLVLTGCFLCVHIICVPAQDRVSLLHTNVCCCKTGVCCCLKYFLSPTLFLLLDFLFLNNSLCHYTGVDCCR